MGHRVAVACFYENLAVEPSSLGYLLYGPARSEERIANLIYSPAYKLNEFGTANVQELVGWWNREELPVINGRITKVLRWLGFDIADCELVTKANCGIAVLNDRLV
jgi:hypothetical protein